MSGGEGPEKPRFTNDDHTYCETYLEHRATLLRLWDLAARYPNVATRIRVRIRAADPHADYYFEEAFADAAIVVDLEWIDTAGACDFLSCNTLYPRGATCKYADVPRVFPSGDATALTACEPACYMMHVPGENAATADDRVMRYYDENSGYVRIRTDGVTYDYMNDENGTHRIVAIGTSAAAIADGDDRATTAAVRPLPYLEYNRATKLCEMGNVDLLAFFTQPYTRSAEHNVCRQDNIAIGDDIVLGGAGVEYAKTARHSRTYCNAFDKAYDEHTGTCEETWYDKVLGYTFVGAALMRLARHAVSGTNGCDYTLPADPGRKEVNATTEMPAFKRSRREWYRSVNRDWCLPPPNVLLSDLGANMTNGGGRVWLNDNAAGGTVVVEETTISSSGRRGGMPDERATSRRALQRRPPPQRSSAQTVDAARSINARPTEKTIPAVGKVATGGNVSIGGNAPAGGTLSASGNAPTGGNTSPQVVTLPRASNDLGMDATLPTDIDDTLAPKRRSRRTAIAAPSFEPATIGGEDRDCRSDERVRRPFAAATSDESFVSFDDAYAKTGSETFLAQVKAIAESLGMIGSSILVEKVASTILRRAYNSVLSNVGKYMLNYTSRALVAAGVRTATARLTSMMLTRLTTKMLLIAGEAASVVGIVVAAVELLSLVLDVMMWFGWDPGNYNSEFDNQVYDDMVRAWNRSKDFNERAEMNPRTLLYLFATRNDRQDGTVDPASRSLVAFTDVENAPWFFSPFQRAVQALIDDTATDDGTHRRAVTDDRPEDTLRRLRPVTQPDNDVIAAMVWSVHYFRHRRHNSAGQRIDTEFGGGDDYVAVTDSLLEHNVRDNEVAYMLHTSGFGAGMSDRQLAGACRRNVAMKTAGFAYAGLFAAACVAGVTLDGALALVLSTRAALLLCALSSLLVLPAILIVTCCETLLCEDHSYDDGGGGDADSTDALVNDLCDSIVAFVAANSSGGNDDDGTSDAPSIPVPFSFLRDYLYNALYREIAILAPRTAAV